MVVVVILFDLTSTTTPTERSCSSSFYRLIKIEAEFYKHVDLSLATRKVGMESELVDFLFRYWLLKRKAGGNKPLLSPRSEELDLLSVTNQARYKDMKPMRCFVLGVKLIVLFLQETEREKMKRFVALRQDLERVRNLCYMVSRREKLQRSWVKLREQILAKQLQLLADKSCAQQMSLMEMSAILEANHGPTVYDRLYSHADAEQHNENDFEVIVARISGVIAENSAQVRKDNPYRSGGAASGGDQGQNAVGGVSYERIFSDMSASETDDILNISASFVTKKGPKGRPSKKGAAGKKPGRKPSKKGASGPAKRVTRSDTSDASADSDFETSRKSKGKQQAAKSSLFSDTDSEDSKSKQPRAMAATFRTKAAMKDFSVEELTRSRKGKEKAKADSGRAKSGAGRGRPKKVVHSASSDEFDSEDDDAVKASKAEQEAGDFYPMIVPERAAARKAAAKLKASEQRVAEMAQPEIYDFDRFDTVVNNIPKDVVDALKEPPKAYVPPSTSHHLSKYKRLFEGDSDSLDSLSDFDSKYNKKKGGAGKKARVPPGFGLVPERKAAKKASAHLKEGGRGGGGAGAASAVAAPAREESPSKSPTKKSPGRPRKKEHLPSFSERIRLSDSDSDQEPFPYKSPRGKSPRGRGALPKSPKKPSGASARATTAHVFPKPRPAKNKALSSAAEAFLSQRESQLDDIFEECGLGSKKSRRAEPDKKLKTSEGRPDGTQSPPAGSSSTAAAAAAAAAAAPTASAAGHKSSSDSSGSDSSSSGSSSSSEDEGAARVAGRKEANQHEAARSAAAESSSAAAAASPAAGAAATSAATPSAKEDSDSDLRRRRPGRKITRNLD